MPKKTYASDGYTDKKQLKFVLDLRENTYTNYSTMEIVLPLQFTKKTNKAQQMDANMITVNNFFGHWFTDIDIRRYPDDVRILPTNNSGDIYQYLNEQMKYLPEKLAKTFLNRMLFSNKPVYLAKDVDRRPNNDNGDDKRSDDNLSYRIKELRNYIFAKHKYRVPLGMIIDLGLVNSAVNAGTKIILTLERDLNRLFESNKN